MENLKTEPFDEKEEGEISLEDVSSPEDNYGRLNINMKKSSIGKKYIKREIDIHSRDYGKENRLFSNELNNPESKPVVTTLHGKNDDLLPISSDDEIEFVGLPGTSKQFAVHVGPKKKRKKKKKKKTGQRMLVIDDLVTAFDDEPDVIGLATDDRRNLLLSRHYGDINQRSPSPIHRMTSPTKHTPWHLPRSPTKHHALLNYGPSPNRRSPSPRQKSMRTFISPRKSGIVNYDRRALHKSPRDISPGRCNDAYACSLLKKIRHLESDGLMTPVNQQKHTESSVKDKLSNMFKNLSKTRENENTWKIDMDEGQNLGVKADDDEDLEFLRRKALETKQLKNDMKPNETSATVDEKPTGNTNISDDDEEDLELRMIALRSAVMKKHYDRVRRGIMRKKSSVSVKDESPFSDSFLDSLDSYLDGDSNDDYNSDDKNQQSLSDAQLLNMENPHEEDMDLDSDVEREKENSQIYPLVNELPQQSLMLEPIIPVESQIETSTDYFSTTDVDQSQINTIEAPQYPNSNTPYFNDHLSNDSSPYSLLDSTFVPIAEPQPSEAPAFTSRDPRLRRHINSNTNMPYSLSNRVMMDPPMSVCPPETPFTRVPLNTNVNHRSSNSSNLIVVPLGDGTQNPSNTLPTPLQSPTTIPPLLGSNAPVQLHESQNTNTKEISAAIDNLQSNVTFNDIIRDLAEYTGEPLYLQGVPDVTKDANKIPTLVNRTLVPVPILKTNKQLQQPLPIKKPTGNSGSSFKSAEMLSVDVQLQQNKSNTILKPIKLQSVAKKNPIIAAPAAGFCNLNDETIVTLPNENNSKIIENSNNASINKTSQISIDSKASDKSHSIITSENVEKARIRRPRTPRNKSETIKKINTSEKSEIVTNEKVKNKSTLEQNAAASENVNNNEVRNKSTEEIRKSTNNDPKERVVKKSEVKRGRRSKSAIKSSDKSNENSKNNSNLKNNEDSTIKQKKDIVKKGSKTKSTKNLDSNIKKTNITNGSAKKSMTTRVDDKKRRSSIDDDENALRAALLASLPKRMKTLDSHSTSTTSQSTTGSVQSMEKNPNNIDDSLDEKRDSETTAMLPPTTVPPRLINKQKTIDENKTTTNTGSNVADTKKRTNLVTLQNPAKKIAKDSSALPPPPPPPPQITDIAKIVNVAEKIIDSEIQRKLALHQAAIGLLSSKVQQNSKKNVSRSNTKDSSTNINSKISVSKSMERMIIRVGEDSDSDSDIDDATIEAKTKNINVPLKENIKGPTIPITDFEKSVEEFLRSQREKQESLTTSLTPTTSKNPSAITSTPLAVRHLPASKQEEYRRLKRRIAEREQQKMKRTAQPSKNLTQETSVCKEPFSSTATANESTSAINVQSQAKNVISNTDDIACRGIKIQTQISQSAMELLQPDPTVYSGGPINTPPILPDIPIKTDPLLVEMTSNITDDNSRINIAPFNNVIKEEVSEANTIDSTRPLENLTIKFTNTRDNTVPYVRHISLSRNDSVHPEQSSTPEVPSLGLRILTIDQVNMKCEDPEEIDVNNDKVQTEDRTIALNNRVQTISHDTPMSYDAMDNSNTVTIDSSITIETCKVEADCETTEPSILPYQATTNLDAPSTIVFKQNDCSTKSSNNDQLNVTIESNSTTVLDSSIILKNEIEVNDESTTISSLNIPNVLLDERQIDPDSIVSTQESSKKIEAEIETQLETWYNLPEDQQRIKLTTLEKELVTKRFVVLHDLNQMAEDIRELEIQNNLAAEVKRLQLQLQEAEKRLQDRRNQTVNMRSKITTAHTVVDDGRDECIKLMKLCRGIGSKVMGAAYKIPNAGSQLYREKSREVAAMMKKLSQQKLFEVDLDEDKKNNTITMECTPNNSCDDKIESNLQLKNSNLEINQNVITVKTEKNNLKIENNNSEVDMIRLARSSSTETLINEPIENNSQKIHEITEIINDGASSSTSNNPPSNNQLNENPNDIDMTISDPTWFKIEDEKSPIQPTMSYESVLTAYNTPRHLDPNGVLCPYELMGTCNDDACPYNHLDANRR